MSRDIKSLSEWLESPKVSEPLKQQLRDLQARSAAGDAAANETLNESMNQELEFGTSGLRGIMGAGNNRMNYHTVAKATQGLADYLLAHYRDSSRALAVCIAYDSRHLSKLFAEAAAMVLCANGLKVYIYDSLRPTPMLSYAIRELQAVAGLVVTASHNPREYNGYKVYGSTGGQITGEVVREILDHIGACDLFESPRFIELEQAREQGLFHLISPKLERSYYDKVKLLGRHKAMVAERSKNLHILYTPLYGAGAQPVSRILTELGYRLDCVKEQMRPDGDFLTTPYPNPEKETVYAIAREIATKTFPDLIFATDPDCDRFGVMVRDERGAYQLLNGNQVGCLLCHYLLMSRPEQGKHARNSIKKSLVPMVYSTIVSTDLIQKLCDQYGATYEEVLPGFKYIAEKVEALEQAAPGSFAFGMEESNGYLVGDFVRDKDGVIAAVLMAELALYYKEHGQTLLDALQAIYERFGYSLEETLFFAMPGQKGQRQIRHIMNQLRCEYLESKSGAAGQQEYSTVLAEVVELKDYLLGINDLPTANVLKLYYPDGSWLAMRPSGTEAKLKIYLSAKGENRQAVLARLEVLRQKAFAIVGQEAELANDNEN